MRKYVVVFLMLVLVLGTPVAALAEEGIEASAKFMETLVSQLKTLLDADNVLGTPIEFEETKIIPVVGYCFGYGFGSGTGSQEGEQGSGVGGGAGGGLMPASILMITKDGEVKIMAAKKGVVSDIMSALAPIVIEAIKAQQMQQSEAPEEEKSPE